MNKIVLLIIAATVVFTAKSQTIDTAFCNSGPVVFTRAAAKITPFKVQVSDTVQVTHLGVLCVQDDSISSCWFEWYLLDDNKIIHSSGQIKVIGTDYTNWNKSDVGALQYIGNKINLIFQ